MIAILPLAHIQARHKRLVGGKSLALAKLMQAGVPVPDGLCITTTVYRDFIRTTGLGTRIGLELGRRPLAAMRWEEIWDMALRIRSLFIHTPIPERIKAAVTPELERQLGEKAVVVRSSSPQEDRSGGSFAGLHDSYVNVRGIEAILDHIRLVWASLWSDAALLYRRELGMDMRTSAMAVIVQTLVCGERSGVAFSLSPDGSDQAVIESVYGLNQGLVDGAIAPDRWTLDRRSGRVLSHTPALRQAAVRPAVAGTRQAPLSEAEKNHPPLDQALLQRVFHLAMALEKQFDRPQDVEWTVRDDTVFLLQSRPVTTARSGAVDSPLWSAGDKRPWYLSLKRSFENLKALLRRIEDEHLPRMAAEADRLAQTDLTRLCDGDLIQAIEARLRIHQHWVGVYWLDFIPFAHGARLFGQVYNDLVKPDDPHAFTALLREGRMVGVQRNRDFQALAKMVRTQAGLRERLAVGASESLDPEFSRRLEGFLNRYGDLTFKAVRVLKEREGLIRLLLELAGHEAAEQKTGRLDNDGLIEDFVSRFPEDRRGFAREILEIGRSSYRLRDDDNIALSRIESQLLKAVDEAKKRLGVVAGAAADRLTPVQVLSAFKEPAATARSAVESVTIDEPVEHQGRPQLTSDTLLTADGDFVMRARQLTGQPAGQGLAMGRARVIAGVSDLFEFKAGEILVCDAIDPNMTLVVPLAAAIVERRGGMLVHGAIIAREYGLPCVTGVDDAVALIHNGDRLTVDGYLGIVTVDAWPDPNQPRP